jgi:UDP-glucose 4-epimerase
MKIIITGGAGFIGSHLTESLIEKNHKLSIITRNSTKNIKNIKNLDIVKIDVGNFKKIEKFILKVKPDLIIHLAGNTSHSKSFEEPQKDLNSNLKSTLNILEIIRKSLPKCKFLLGSTFVVIGKPKKLPIEENSPTNPTTLYGVNKLSSEYYTKIYNQLYNIDTRIFRITNSFGPREQIIPKKNAINYLIYKAYKGEDISIYENGKFFRDLIYVSDVISGINKIILKGKAGELYWIGSGKKTWFYQIAKILEKVTNAKTKYVKTPNYTKKVDVGNFVINNSKLRSLGWSPKVSVEEGIIKTIEYFKINKI